MGLFLLCSGPAALCVSWGTQRASTLFLLGFAEEGVYTDIDPKFVDVMCDLAGTRVPIDIQYMLKEGHVMANVKLVDPTVFGLMQQRAAPGGGLDPLFDPAGSQGGLMLQEEAAQRLYIDSPYALLKPTQAGTLPFNFPDNAILVGPERFDPYGTTAMKIHCVWRILPRLQADGSWRLGNRDATGRPTITI